MTYFVVAKKWNAETQKQVKYIAGQFDDFANAEIFKKAYNNIYNASAEIKEASQLVNL